MATEPRKRYQGGESPQVRPSLNPRASGQSSYVDLTYLSRYFDSSPLTNFSALSEKLTNLFTRITDQNQNERDREMAQTMEADLRIAEGLLRTEGPVIKPLADDLLSWDQFGQEISLHEEEKKPRTGMLTNEQVEILRAKGGDRINRRIDDPRYSEAFDLRLAILHADSFGEQETSKVLINLPEYLDEVRNQPQNRERFNFDEEAQAYVVNHFNSLPETHALNSYPGAKELYISKALGSGGYRSIVNSAGGSNRKAAAIGINSEAGRGLLEAVDSGPYVDKSTSEEEVSKLDTAVDPFLSKMRVMADQLGQAPNAATYGTAIKNAVMFKYPEDYEKQHDSFMRLRQYFLHKGKKDPVYGELAGIFGEMGRQAFERLNQLESNFGFENQQETRNFLTYLSTDFMENFEPDEAFFTKPDSEQRQEIQAWLLKESPNILKRIGFEGRESAIRLFSANAPQVERIQETYSKHFTEMSQYGVTAANKRAFAEISKQISTLSSNGQFPTSEMAVAVIKAVNEKYPNSKRVDANRLLSMYEQIDASNETGGNLFKQAAKNLKSEFGPELKMSPNDIGADINHEYKSLVDKFHETSGQTTFSIEDVQKVQNQAIQNVRNRLLETSNGTISQLKEDLSELFMMKDPANINPIKIDSAKQLLSKFDRLLKIPAYGRSQELAQMRERLNTAINAVGVDKKKDVANFAYVKAINDRIKPNEKTELFNAWLNLPDTMANARFAEGLSEAAGGDSKTNELVKTILNAGSGDELVKSIFRLSLEKGNSVYSVIDNVAIFDPSRLPSGELDLPRLPHQEAVAFSRISKYMEPKPDGSTNPFVRNMKINVGTAALTEGNKNVFHQLASRVKAAAGDFSEVDVNALDNLTRDLAIHGVGKATYTWFHDMYDINRDPRGMVPGIFEWKARKDRARSIKDVTTNVFTPDALASIQQGRLFVAFPDKDSFVLFNEFRLALRGQIAKKIKDLGEEFKANKVNVTPQLQAEAVNHAMEYLFRNFVDPSDVYLDTKNGFNYESIFFSRQTYGAYLSESQGNKPQGNRPQGTRFRPGNVSTPNEEK